MALDWIPIYPAVLLKDRGLTAVFGPFHAAQALPQSQILAGLWARSQPSFPALLFRRQFRIPGGMVQPYVSAAAATVPPLAWKGTFPDRLDRRQAHPSRAPFLTATVRIVAPTDVRLDWTPNYPARIDRLRPHASRAPFLFYEGRATIAPTALSWKAIYPDRIDPKPRVPAQVAFAMYPRPVPAPDPPGIGYRTAVYPDQVWPKISIRTAQQQAFASNIVPIPNPPPPVFLTWLPRYPDRFAAIRRLQPQIRIVGTLASPVLELDLRWAPQYPALLFRRTPAVRTEAFGALFQFSHVIPSTFSLWQPVYPDFVFRVPPPPPPGSVIVLPVPPDQVVERFCIMLEEDDAASPYIANELVTSPYIADEIFGDQTITPEETC